MFEAPASPARALPPAAREPRRAHARDARGAQPRRVVVLPHAGDQLHGLRRRRRAPSGSSRSTSCRGSCRPRSGRRSSAGSSSAMRALNLFLQDVYHDQKILAAGVVPARARVRVAALPARDDGRATCPAGSTRTSSASTSSATATARYLVLEDNLRTPSGVSYMLENRMAMKRIFPPLFSRYARAAGRGLPARAARDAALGRAARRRDPTSCC